MRRLGGFVPRLWVPVFLLLVLPMSAAVAQEVGSSTEIAENAGLSSPDEGDSLTVSVEEAEICLRVSEESRQPEGAGDRFSSDVGHLTCFTRIKGGKGTEVVHAWIHEGHTRARVTLKVGSDSWRTWSTKRILRSWTGRWEVKIMTPDGVVLKSVPFTVY